MEQGQYRWNTKTELQTRCKLTVKLQNGHKLFTAKKGALATAVLMPDGETLDITIWADRVAEKWKEKNVKNTH